MKTKLNIGFIVDANLEVPAWYFETIHNIVTQADLTVFFIRIRQNNSKIKQPFFYQLFQNFENRWFGSNHDANKKLSVLSIGNIVSIEIETTDGLLLREEELQRLKLYQTDLIYTIEFDETYKENISAAATYGLWFIQIGNQDCNRTTPAAFWEVMKNKPVTESNLMARINGEQWLLYEGSTRSVPYSVKNNFNSIAWKSSSYLTLRLTEFILNREAFFSHYKKTKEKEQKTEELPNISIPILFLKNSFRYIGNKIRGKIKTERFRLFYSHEKFSLSEFTQTKFTPIGLQAGGFYADPFVIEKENVHYVFFEEYVDSKNKAHISVIEIDKGKNISLPRPVLDLPYHLSYPFVFLHEGYYYMIPETSSNQTVELYRARNFPDNWEFVMNLMEGMPLIDVTVHFENGKWWLFANSAHHPFVSTDDQLFLFHNDDLFSADWIPHPQNPIATKIDNCRPAGRIFRHENKLYRPAQNNASQQYGYGLKINEITVLNENHYEEKEILSLKPEQLGLKACHHLDFSGSLIVIDGI